MLRDAFRPSLRSCDGMPEQPPSCASLIFVCNVHCAVRKRVQKDPPRSTIRRTNHMRDIKQVKKHRGGGGSARVLLPVELPVWVLRYQHSAHTPPANERETPHEQLNYNPGDPFSAHEANK